MTFPSNETTEPWTLVLNASYEVLGVVPLGRALMLVLETKADQVQSDGVIRSSTTTYDRPVVIRLKRYVHVPYDPGVPLSRRSLSVRDNGQCQYCSGVGETIDHVVPKSRGGSNTWENCVLACKRCNNKKGSNTLAELGWALPRRPFRPTRKHMFLPILHHSWAAYIRP